jgi:hypothetical protein
MLEHKTYGFEGLKRNDKSLSQSKVSPILRDPRSSYRNPFKIPVLAQNVDMQIPATVNGTDAP